MSEGEGEGDQHQGEDEAKEKEPNVEFLLSASEESETASCLNFPGLTGPLYPHVLRGEFLSLTPHYRYWSKISKHKKLQARYKQTFQGEM